MKSDEGNGDGLRRLGLLGFGDLRPRPAGGARRARRAGVDRRESGLRRRRRRPARAGRGARRAGVAPRSRKPGSRRRAQADAAPGTGQAIPRRRRPPRAGRDRGPVATVGAVARRLRCRSSRRFAGRVTGRRAEPGGDRRPAGQLRSHPRATICWRRSTAPTARRRRDSRVPREQRNQLLAELAEDEDDERHRRRPLREPRRRRGRARPVAPADAGQWCASSSGGGPPGADAPTHRTRTGTPGAATRPRSRRARQGRRGRSRHRRPGDEVPRVGRSSPALPPGLVHGAGGRAAARGRHAFVDVGRVRLASTARPPRHGPRSLPPAGAGRRHRHRCGRRGTRRGDGRVGARRGLLRRQPSPPARSRRARPPRRLGLRGRARCDGPDGARATAGGGRRAHRRSSRDRRSRGALRLPLAGAIRRAPGAGEALRRRSRHPRDAAPSRPRAGRLLEAGCGDPAWRGGAGGTGRDVAAVARRAVRRASRTTTATSPRTAQPTRGARSPRPAAAARAASV